MRGNSGNPVLQGTAGAFDADGVYGADVVYDPTDPIAPYKMWYSGRQGVVRWDRLRHLHRRADLDQVLRRQAAAAPGSRPRHRRVRRQLQRGRSVRAQGRLGLEDVVHGRRLEQEAHRLRDLAGRHDLGQGRQGHRAGGSGRERQHRNSAPSRRRCGRRRAASRCSLPAASSSAAASSRPRSWRRRRPTVSLDRAEPGAQPGRREHELRLLQPELARPALRPRQRRAPTSSTTPATRSTPTATSTRASASRPRATATRSTSSTARRRAARCSTSAPREPRSTRGRPPVSRRRRRPEATRSSWASTGARAAATSSRGSARRPRPTGAPGRRSPAAADGGAVLASATRARSTRAASAIPRVLYDSGTYDLYFTGLGSGGTESIGFASTPEISATKQPDNASWSARQRRCSHAPASTAAAVSHPSVIKDGADLRHVLHRPVRQRRPSAARRRRPRAVRSARANRGSHPGCGRDVRRSRREGSCRGQGRRRRLPDALHRRRRRRDRARRLRDFDATGRPGRSRASSSTRA